jgi:hypothetical protein
MGIILFPLLIIGIAIYFIPTFIAASRQHKNTLAIVLVNILTGWTFIGWIVALVWSVAR